jgi:hypothetical protein
MAKRYKHNTPKRTRAKKVHVKGYCRRKGQAAYRKAAQQAKEWGF